MYILGQIAIYSLEKGCCFFEQIELDYCITASIREQETDDWGLVQDEIVTQTRLTFLQQGVLLEQACGIFSFSHIAFQEHLAARQIVSNSNLEEGLAKLFSHLTEPVWREVFY